MLGAAVSAPILRITHLHTYWRGIMIENLKVWLPQQWNFKIIARSMNGSIHINSGLFPAGNDLVIPIFFSIKSAPKKIDIFSILKMLIIIDRLSNNWKITWQKALINWLKWDQNAKKTEPKGERKVFYSILTDLPSPSCWVRDAYLNFTF